MIGRRTLLAALLPGSLTAGVVRAQGERVPPPEVAAQLPTAQLSGQGRISFLTLTICDARLWTLPGFKPDDASSEPLALELEYARTLRGEAVAERSLVEMQRVARVSESDGARWLDRMKAIFPDVRKGDRLTGVQVPGEAALFYFNGARRGVVRDAAFTRAFFAIWLSPQTSDPVLRERLMRGRG